MNALQKVRSIVDEIKAAADPLRVVDNWALAGRLLSRMPADQAEVTEAVQAKDIAALDAIVTKLESPEPAATSASQAEAKTYETATLQAAMKAFKKRLKLGRLADESRLGGRYTSGGRSSKIDAIEAPREFEPGVWKTLAADGKLIDRGQGFYSIPGEGDGPPPVHIES